MRAPDTKHSIGTCVNRATRHAIGRSRGWRSGLVIALLIATGLISPRPAAGQPSSPEPPSSTPGEPLQCWWRTAAPTIRVGEALSVVLTCAVINTQTMTVAADESSLAPEAIQLAPFEVLDGNRASDLPTDDRRFFQYRYRVRLVSDVLFGSDVLLAGVRVKYRVQSQTGDGTALEGLEQTYELPALSVRVLSLVTADANDIRDAPPETFTDLDDAAFRARVLTTGGGVLMLVSGLLLAVALATAIARGRVKTPTTPALLSDTTVLGSVSGALARVRVERQAAGWTPALAGQALAALRIAGTCVLAQPASQRDAGTEKQIEGALLYTGRNGRRVAISSAVTPETVELERRAEGVEAERLHALDGLHEALSAFTRACYGRESECPDNALDGALTSADDMVRSLRRTNGWTARQYASTFARLTSLGRQVWSR